MKRYQDIEISSSANYVEENDEETGEDELVFTQEDQFFLNKCIYNARQDIETWRVFFYKNA